MIALIWIGNEFVKAIYKATSGGSNSLGSYLFTTIGSLDGLKNADKFLDQTINSIQNQQFNNWELVLINDGSTDVVDAKGIKEVETYFEGLNTTYAPNAPLNKKWTISWTWAFSTGDANDKLDTQLGDEAAKTTGQDANVVTEFTFGIKATIEQLD